MTLYAVLKFLHVLSVVVWIGGATALAMIVSRVVRGRDRATLAALLPHSIAYGQRMAGPSSILVLITGIALVAIGKFGFNTFWVAWGFAGVLVHFIVGTTLLRRRTMALMQLVSASPQEDVRITEAGARLRSANILYLLIMYSVIAAMVLKPTL
jgi:uncharacterized membrane protein